MPIITLTVPFPPSVNKYWRRVMLPLGKGSKGYRAQTLLSEAGRAYKRDVATAVMLQKAARGITSPVAVHVTLHAPDNRLRDLDNSCKSLLDALVHAGVLQDDCLVHDLRLVWGQTLQGGKAVVSIRALPGAAAMQPLPLMENAQ